MNATSLNVKVVSGLFALAMSLGLSQAISTGMARSTDDLRAAAAQNYAQVAQNPPTPIKLEPIQVTVRRVRVIEI